MNKEYWKILKIGGIVMLSVCIVGTIIIFKFIEYEFPINEKGKQALKTQVNIQENLSFDWKSLSQDYLFHLVGGKSYLVEETGIVFLQEVDLTGDGAREGIFMGNGGNNNLSFILVRSNDGKISVAESKGKDGTIGTVSLLEVGRVMQQAGFKLLPAENGYYDEAKSYDYDKDIWTCGHFDAYKWNPQTKVFEWNKIMTDKYINQVCNGKI